MHSIGILSDSHDWHSEEIDFFLKKNNCDVIKLNFDDFLLKLKNNKITFLNNKKIAKLDGVWVRYINTGSIEEITTKLTILHLLEKMKIYVHNSATVIEKTVGSEEAVIWLLTSTQAPPPAWNWMYQSSLLAPIALTLTSREETSIGAKVVSIH